MDRQDVRMLELRGEADLSEKTLGAEHRRELRMEDLQRHGTAVLQIARQVDPGHPAAPELALEQVAAAKSISKW
jgi:hypothetical protein